MKAVMISINKPHTDNIFDEIKTVEWRTKPLPIGKHFVYETKNKGGCGKVIGKMDITENIPIVVFGIDCQLGVNELIKHGCVNAKYLIEYADKHKASILYANVIENAKRYDKPKEIGEFKNLKAEPITRAFQSWGYINA